MNKEKLKNLIVETVKEKLAEREMYEEPAGGEGEAAAGPKGMSPMEMRKVLLQISKDSRTIQKIAPQEREAIVGLLTQVMDLALQKNITTGTVQTLMGKIFNYGAQQGIGE